MQECTKLEVCGVNILKATEVHFLRYHTHAMMVAYKYMYLYVKYEVSTVKRSNVIEQKLKKLMMPTTSATGKCDL